eukprot:TRINITY_DN8514_c0_g1_i4.p1 TRINITY_DN8514_c0_g1~~TRINITY_DN8514_c0_g1_i4.p1  ORF type:complete len:117 (+),score=21.77 TRINITY_DN8514_c0_g1_i4:358-708(+)
MFHVFFEHRKLKQSSSGKKPSFVQQSVHTISSEKHQKIWVIDSNHHPHETIVFIVICFAFIFCIPYSALIPLLPSSIHRMVKSGLSITYESTGKAEKLEADDVPDLEEDDVSGGGS